MEQRGIFANTIDMHTVGDGSGQLKSVLGFLIAISAWGPQESGLWGARAEPGGSEATLK